jgi:hypothetical protein
VHAKPDYGDSTCHLAAAFILARTQQLLTNETRKPWRPKQGKQCRQSPQSGFSDNACRAAKPPAR